MLVGVPREVKSHEYRVATTPAGNRLRRIDSTRRGHLRIVVSNSYEVAKAHGIPHVPPGQR